jgi:hypothetical protein
MAALLPTAKHSGFAELRSQLTTWKVGLRMARKRQAVEQLLGTVTDPREMKNSPVVMARVRLIGVGATESMCRPTTVGRKEGAGAATGTTPRPWRRWRHWTRAGSGSSFWLFHVLSVA